MDILYGILLGLALTVIGAIALAKTYATRLREAAPQRLEEARRAREEGRDAEALALLGETFWVAPAGSYSADSVRLLTEALREVRSLLSDHSEDVARQLDPLLAEFEVLDGEAGAVSPALLEPVATFLADVADDKEFSRLLLEQMDEDSFEYRLGPSELTDT